MNALDTKKITLVTQCPITGETVEVLWDQIGINPNYSECDLCGQHGATAFTLACPSCKQWHDWEGADQ